MPLTYDRTDAEYARMRKTSDRLCREYGLSVVDNPKPTKTPRMIWEDEKAGKPTKYNLMRWAIDETIRQSMTMTQFVANMKLKGYEINYDPKRKYSTIKTPEFAHATKLLTLGERYDIPAIKERIYANKRPEIALYQKVGMKQYRLAGSLQKARKFTGFRALYISYCYLLGAFPNRHQVPLSPAIKEAVRQLQEYSRRTVLLCKNKIDTRDQLNAFIASTEAKISELTALRQKIQNVLRRKNKPDNFDELSIQRDALTSELKRLRLDLRTANNIEDKTDKVRRDINAEMKMVADQLPKTKNKERGYTR